MHNIFLESQYKNIPGITEINSEKKGKTLAIFGITHGNEPVGLEIFSCIQKYFIDNKLQKGRILLIAGNIKAYHQKKRFIDDNMNRISLGIENKKSYEYKRLRELRKIYNEIDIAIDLHSLSQGDDHMLICDHKDVKFLNKVCDIPYSISDNLNSSTALIGDFIREGKLAFGIECGNHTSDKSAQRGFHNILLFLQELGYITKNHISVEKKHTSIALIFYTEIIPLSDSFSFTKKYAPFEEIKPGEIYARDQELDFKNNTPKSLYIGLIGNMVHPGDGICFLFKKIED